MTNDGTPPDTGPDDPKTAGAQRKPLTPAARRALAEAEARRAEREAQAAKADPRAQEINGPKGEEPTRYGDWERNGIASDF